MSCSHPSSSRRPPQRGAAPIRPQPVRTLDDAFAVFDLAMSRPLRVETLGFLLDDSGCGRTVFAVADTESPDALLDVAECLAAAGERVPEIASLVLASVRPEGGDRTDADDMDRWMEASDIAGDRGLVLLEWFIVTPAMVCLPRVTLGEPSRWPR